MNAELSSIYRDDAIDRLANEHFDILVVGGGVVGCGVALDAVTRGLNVALVEARDIAAGTSSRSSKLIHGGLRYLEMLDFGLVAEALGERGRLIEEIAPHLVRPVPFLFPLKRRVWERFYVGAGIGLYDAMASMRGRGGIPRHRHLSRRRIGTVASGVRTDTLAGGIAYHDAQVDDARFTLALARTAAQYGALITTGTELVQLNRRGDVVVGGTVVDAETGRSIEVTAGAVVNATGVWHDEVTELATDAAGFSVRMSKGVHLTVPRDRIDSTTGMIIRTDKSVLFVIPWSEDLWVVGTTDTPWSENPSEPVATVDDVHYLLEQVNAVLRDPLTTDDVVGIYAGLRPLIHGESAETAKLSREHALLHPTAGFVSIAGGKYTTYRVMAKDAVDEAVKDIASPAGPCCTEQVPLLGAAGLQAAKNTLPRVAAAYGIPADAVSRLLDRYGSEAATVVDLCREDPSLACSLDGAPRYLTAEIHYAVTHEGARTLEDILDRRTRIAMETADGGVHAAQAVAAIAGPLLGWSPERVDRELDAFAAKTRMDRAALDGPVLLQGAGAER